MTPFQQDQLRYLNHLAAIGQLMGSGGGGPVAAFTGDPTSGGDPTNVEFTNTSTNATDYLWEKRLLPGDWAAFDGDSGADEPTETFTGVGDWDVRLTATGPGGSDTLTRLSYISIIS